MLSPRGENDTERRAIVERETGETSVSVELALDGTGEHTIETGHGFFDHMLAQLSRHSLIDLNVRARGDTQTGWHHTIEDVAIVLGRALRQALGDGRGIARMGHALVPLDEALAQVAVDLSGRGHASIDTGVTEEQVEGLPSDLVRHALETFAVEARITLHVHVLSGSSPHHRVEAAFKALARALRDAVARDPGNAGSVPSTKDTIG